MKFSPLSLVFYSFCRGCLRLKETARSPFRMFACLCYYTAFTVIKDPLRSPLDYTGLRGIKKLLRSPLKTSY